MTKQEKIQEAYGEYWDNFILQAKECALKNDGWISSILEHAPKSLDLEFENYQYRPKSLQGIENNNGWIKIESEADLILPDGEYFGVFPHDYGNDNRVEYFYSKNKRHYQNGINTPYEVTHYQPIKKPNSPIY